MCFNGRIVNSVAVSLKGCRCTKLADPPKERFSLLLLFFISRSIWQNWPKWLFPLFGWAFPIVRQ